MQVLIIDGEDNIRRSAAAALEGLGHEPIGAADTAEALRQMRQTRFDVAFLDLKLKGESGLDLLPALTRSDPRLDVVVFTPVAAADAATEALRRGAVDYLAKPFTPDQVAHTLRRVIQTRRLQGRVAELESRLPAPAPPAGLATIAPALQTLYHSAATAAVAPATVFLRGESGTGKTVLARFIHDHSPQRDNEFITVNCPTLPREWLESTLFGCMEGARADSWGKVAEADGGTLFLDEIGDLPLETQPKLLRLLRAGEYQRLGEPQVRRANLRVIAASNRNLEQAVQEGRFRDDLFQRLNALALHLPPLRQRPGELIPLATSHLQFYARQCGKPIRGFAPEAELKLRGYSWPGNLRELRNVIERAVILAAGELIGPSDLPEGPAPPGSPGQVGAVQVGAPVTLEELEKEHIRRLLALARSQEHAARLLGIDPTTLWRKRKRYAL